MKKINRISLSCFFILTLILTGCAKSNGAKNYILTDYGVDPNFKVLEMKTVDANSDYFTMRYDENVWELQEWDPGVAPNIVVLVNKGYENNKCALLPGTVGSGLGEGNQVIEGSLLTARYVGKTIDVFNPAGVQLMHVVGYEIGEQPYIFEVRLPAKSPQQCLADSQAVISSFNVAQKTTKNEEGTESSSESTESSDPEEAENGELNVGGVTVEEAPKQ